ncbi:MAG: branched-chain amino acid aminotransferase [Rubinisphaera brasiliensis]|uniref:branched-chain amino acid aminotransferase n=1 Tax=Rubinisphaera brasiliensis TaxID=119 RepID=UPI00391ADF43
MFQLIRDLYADEAGFIISSEMVLVGTITVLGMVVGLSEVAFNINQELEDVGSAFGSINQAYSYTGAAGGKGSSNGSSNNDEWDHGDHDGDVICDVAPTGESY